MTIAQPAQGTPSTPTRDQIRTDVRNQIRDAVRDAQAAAQEAGNEARVITRENGPNGGRTVVQLPNGQQLILNGDNVHLDGEPTTVIAPDFRDAVPDGAVDIVQALVAMVVLCVVGFPLARAIARWIDRRTAGPKVPAEVLTRLASIETAVETVAVEVERISEGQRFTTKLLNERAREAVPR